MKTWKCNKEGAGILVLGIPKSRRIILCSTDKPSQTQGVLKWSPHLYVPKSRVQSTEEDNPSFYYARPIDSFKRTICAHSYSIAPPVSVVKALYSIAPWASEVKALSSCFGFVRRRVHLSAVPMGGVFSEAFCRAQTTGRPCPCTAANKQNLALYISFNCPDFDVFRRNYALIKSTRTTKAFVERTVLTLPLLLTLPKCC